MQYFYTSRIHAHVLQLTSKQILVPAGATYQAANFFQDESAAQSASLTNVSPYAPQASGQYSVTAAGLYTFYSGDIGKTLAIAYDATTTSTAPTSTNTVAISAQFGTATPDFTGAPSGSVSFNDTDTGNYYNATLTLDPTATWVAGTGGQASALGTTNFAPTVLDFNNDLIPDVLLVDDGIQSGTPSLQLLIGTLPSGSFASGNVFSIQSVLPNCATISSYAVADFNRDGYPDVAILCTSSSTSSNTLSILLGIGDGTFSTSPLTFGNPVNGTQIVAADFDGDGNPDIAYTGTVSYTYPDQKPIAGVQVLKNPNGDGNLQLPDFATQIPMAVGTQIIAADFDQDGYADIAILNGDPNNPNIVVYQNVGSQAGNIGIQFNNSNAPLNPAVTPPTTIATPGRLSVSSFSVLALQQNLPPSIVFPVTGSTNPGVYAARNTGTTGSSSAPGTIAFAATLITPVTGLANAVFGDINGDGNLDAIIDNGTKITALTGDGSGSFKGTTFTTLSLSDTNNTLIAAVDLNYDGYADLLTNTVKLLTYVRPGGGVTAHAAAQPHDSGSGNNLGSYISAGTATATTTPASFPSGPHDFEISTPGTVQIASGSATASFTVSNYTTSVAVTSTGTPYPYGQSLQVYATVTGGPSGTPTGNVSFYDGTNFLATFSLINGTTNFAVNGLSIGSHNLTAQYATDGTYPAAVSPVYTQVITAATPAVTWATPAAITYGTALSATQLNAIAKDGNGNALAGTFKYTPALGAVLGAGSQTLSVLFTPTDAVDYTTATKTVTLAVNKATPTLTWATPAAITYGTALSATQLNAVAKDSAGNTVAGTYTYTPAAGKVLGAGSQPLSVTFTPTDATDYTIPTLGNSIQVNKATPSLTWSPSPVNLPYGTALVAGQLDAAAQFASTAVPGTFTYTYTRTAPTAATGAAAIGTVLTAGTYTLTGTFTPTDATDFVSGTKINSVTFTVTQATPTLVWATPAAITYGTALSATQLNATAKDINGNALPGLFTYTPTTGTILGAGSQPLSVTFTPTDTTDYSTPTLANSILVNKATPSITWTTPTAITYGTALSAAQLNATSPIPGVFTYLPAAGAILNAGTQSLSTSFVPTDAADYLPVPLTTVSLLVNKANPLLTYSPTPLNLTYGTALAASQLNATSSDPTGTFLYTYTGTATGTATLGNILGAGTYALKATFTPTDTNYNVASINGGSLVVAQATPVLSWATPADIIAGVPLSATQLNATVGGAIPGVLAYTPASGTVLSAGNGQTLSVKFTPTDLIDYLTATKTAAINVIPLVLSTALPGNALLGDPDKLITLTGTGFLTNSVVQANGTPLATTYVNATTLTATIPASYFLSFSPISITVLDPTQVLSTNPLAMTIAAPVPVVTFTGPATMPSGQQPSLTYTLNNPYPVPLNDTITLTFAGTGGADDPAIQFATGGRTVAFTIPAGSTVTPNLQFQDGTDAGTITATLKMTALGTNVTPTSATPVNIVIPPAAPAIASATLTRSGNTLTIFIVGYSNTRDMTTATFHFYAAPGATINDPNFVITAPALFTPWFSTAASQAYGSNFGYTQTFTLDSDASSVASVSIMLSNSFGNSISVTAQ